MFYIGDLCHVLPLRVMDEFQSHSRDFGDRWGDERDGCQYVYYEYNGESGVVGDPGEFPEGYTDTDGEFMFSMYSTWNGDGIFYDKKGNSYGVDMGCIGVVSITPEIKEKCHEMESRGLGKVFSWDDFSQEDWIGDPPSRWCNLPRLYRNGKGCFIFGESVIIPTGG